MLLEMTLLAALAGQDAPAAPATPRWARQPMPEFPQAAFARGIAEGRVVLECTAGADGAPTDCVVQEETPPDVGFGEAVLAATLQARLDPSFSEQSPPGGRFRFMTSFRMALDELTIMPPRPGASDGRPPPVFIPPTPRPGT